MTTKPIRTHFIGIGGAAMAGAALLAHELGHSVRGSDQNVYSPTKEALKENHIHYNTEYSAKNLSYKPDLIVLGNAISRGNVELEEALNQRFRIFSLPEFIAEFVIGARQSLVIAGTHGKTTTTALVTHLLRHNGVDVGYMIGGVAENFSQSAALGSADVFVIEGDEYDTSIFDPRSKFLSYRPTRAIINNIEFDHADIFASIEEIERTFAYLVKIIPQNGALVTNMDNEICCRLATRSLAPVLTFGKSEKATYRLLQTQYIQNKMRVTLGYSQKEENFTLPILGEHNAMNFLAALALLEQYNLSAVQIQSALDTFRSVKRRLEVRLDNKAVTIIEDFAHHPTAIEANLKILRTLYPKRRLVVLIEPRSNTMVRRFFQERLVDALSAADVIFSDDIYRKEKYSVEERLNLARLENDLKTRGKKFYLLPKESRTPFVTERLQEGDVVCFMTNGSFSGLIGDVVEKMGEEQ